MKLFSSTINAKHLIVFCVLCCAAIQNARADEGGVPFWFSGQFASFAAVPLTPGYYLPTTLYYYNGSASARKVFPKAGSAAANVSSVSPILLIEPTVAFNHKIFDGELSFGLGFGYGQNQTTGTITQSTLSIRKSDTDNGITDLYPFMSLSWAQAANNEMIYLTGDLPFGSYAKRRLANIGIGHGAIDGGVGYTYYDQQSGAEGSFVIGITENFENNATHYRNGIDSHLDYALSRVFTNAQIGLVGYEYIQLTRDSGEAARYGAFKSKVAAIGPEFGYFFMVSPQPWYLNLRAYKEFWSQNRVKGCAVYTSLAIPL